MSGKRWFTFAAALVATILTTAAAPAASPKPVLRLTAFSVQMGDPQPNPQRIQIVIERWSTDEERTKLVDTLANKGADALADALQSAKPQAGYIRTDFSLGWHIAYAREHALPNGGRKIVFATDRPMTFAERASRDRSSTYPFLICEIHLDANGVGEGKLVPAARLSVVKGDKTIEVENYQSEPVSLTKVTVDKDDKADKTDKADKDHKDK